MFQPPYLEHGAPGTEGDGGGCGEARGVGSVWGDKGWG